MEKALLRCTLSPSGVRVTLKHAQMKCTGDTGPPFCVDKLQRDEERSGGFFILSSEHLLLWRFLLREASEGSASFTE